MISDITYKDYRKQDDIHGTIIYPAPMVAPVQKAILKELLDKERPQIVFDPFHGSGTALYEAYEVSDNVRAIGCDINPLANLITRVKLEGIDLEIIDQYIDKMKELVFQIDVSKINFSFSGMKKWFRQDIIEDLKRIKYSITEIEDVRIRRFFWYHMADIVRRYCNSRTSTYKLHIKDDESINNLKNHVIDDFFKKVEKNKKLFYKNVEDFILYKDDILKIIQNIPDNECDIVITSPPYGDNQTTVPYGQYSMLPLYWIDSEDLELEGWELDNYSIIDNRSMGGHLLKESDFSLMEKDLLKKYLDQISDKKKQKVINFFGEYFKFLREVCRVSKKYIVMTLGNRKVDGIRIDLTDITMKILENYGFRNKQLLSREIPRKRTPKKTSKVNNESVTSMTSEYVIIHEFA